jgi:DNA topoisomerase-2
MVCAHKVICLHGCDARGVGDQDGNAIEMAFSKKRVDERKEWLGAYTPGTFLDNSASAISYHDFIHKV